MIQISIINEQSRLTVDERQLRAAVELVLHEAALVRACVSVAVVDDATIHQLNRQYLEHDYPTDVLSFTLEQSADAVEGEVVVSADTARDRSLEYGWPAENELLLYVIHGTLHLVGYRDGTPRERARMRLREVACLAHFGLKALYDAADSPPEGRLRPGVPAEPRRRKHPT